MLTWLTRLVALFLFALPASAQSTLQLKLDGRIAPESGSTIDIEIVATPPEEGAGPRSVSLHMVLLQDTMAADVASLLDLRLRDAKIRHVLPAASADRLHASLFVEDATRILVRVSDGLTARVGLTERGPTSVLLLPPVAHAGAAKLTFHGTTSDARLRTRGAIDFAIDLRADTSPTQAVELLANTCASANWLSERPSHDTWKPSVSFEGLELVGTSFSLEPGSSDWGLELVLP
ncbi:MAG: hypothetical protein IPJ19_00495 [Planctomycetes bacterium]|nr:hypothetical protein [Planctomycetota bacterium]